MILTLTVILVLKGQGEQAKERARTKAYAMTGRSMGSAGASSDHGTMEEAW